MFKINVLGCLKFSSQKLRHLCVPSRCISACFDAIKFPRAGEWFKTLSIACRNPQNFMSNSARTMCKKTNGTAVKQRDNNFNCFNILRSQKHFLRADKSAPQTKTLRCFSCTSKDVLPDDSTQEKYDFEDKNIVDKDTKKSRRMFGHHEYQFDANGYLSVDDVVKFLRQEAAFDICVIETTGAKRAYVDYFIVVSGVSHRHIRAMSKNLEQLVRVNSATVNCCYSCTTTPSWVGCAKRTSKP